MSPPQEKNVALIARDLPELRTSRASAPAILILVSCWAASNAMAIKDNRYTWLDHRDHKTLAESYYQITSQGGQAGGQGDAGGQG